MLAFAGSCLGPVVRGLSGISTFLGTAPIQNDPVRQVVYAPAPSNARQSSELVRYLFDRTMLGLSFLGRETAKAGTELTMCGVVCLSPYVLKRICENHPEDPICSTVQKGVTSIVALLAAVKIATISLKIFLRTVEDCRTSFSRKKREKSVAELSGIVRNLSQLRPHDISCSELMRASFEGNLTEIQDFQKAGAPLELRDKDGRTALHWAAIGRKQAAMEWLWYFGADPLTPDLRSLLPIHYLPERDPLYERCNRLMDTRNRFQLERPTYLFYPPENLVFKGGGAKGLTYVGVQRCLEEWDLLRNVKRVAGTSAGAITAILVALGYSSRELEAILKARDLSSFLDHAYQSEQELLRGMASLLDQRENTSLGDCAKTVFGVLRWIYVPKSRTDVSLNDFFLGAHQRGGLCSGDAFSAWIEALISAKTGRPNCTFGEYKELQASQGFKEVYVYATRITPGDLVCFNSEDDEWRDVTIASAIRASMSIPLVFSPSVLQVKNALGEVANAPNLGRFLDGGIANNLPVNRFDCERYRSTNDLGRGVAWNRQTLAFNLIDSTASKENSANGEAFSLYSVAISTASALLNAEEMRLFDDSRECSRVVPIDSQGVGLISGFFAGSREKEALLQSGIRSMQQFMRRQEDLALEGERYDPRKPDILSIGEGFRSRAIPLGSESRGGAGAAAAAAQDGAGAAAAAAAAQDGAGAAAAAAAAQDGAGAAAAAAAPESLEERRRRLLRRQMHAM